MKMLFTTTAIVLALGLPATLLAQTADIASTDFLSERAMNQMLATDLIGHDVYARRTPVDMSAADNTATPGVAMATMSATDLDTMDNIGTINDLVLSNDGAVVALVIGVGGFLGVGEQDVAVNMNEVSFATNADKAEDMYIMVNTSGEMLKTSPPFNRAGTMNADASEGGMVDRAVLTAPSMTRDGYGNVNASDVSIEMLIGKTVYGMDDTDVGKVDDVTVDSFGVVQNVIIDFGGFLGMGATQVALGFEELTILTNAENADIRIYVDATQDQIKAMPVYTASN